MATTTNKRAERVWARLIQSYGTRIAEMYGASMPEPWTDAVADLSEEQLQFGLRAVLLTSPIHPPALGQFMQACANMPIQQIAKGPTIPEQLCAYASKKFRVRLELWQFSRPWTYVYREWWDAQRPKGLERCAECIGVVIDLEDGEKIGVSTADMLTDTAGHNQAMQSFRPGPPPTQAQRDTWRAAIKP